METTIRPSAYADEVPTIIATIRDKERIHLHNCLYCSQADRLLHELLPLLDLLKEYDHDSFVQECRHLTVGMLSFIKSYVYTTTRRYDPNAYSDLGDLGLSGFREDLLGADALFQDLLLLELSDEDRSVLRAYQQTLAGLINNVGACLKEVLRRKRKMRLRYYLDGPGKALLLVMACFILLLLLVQLCG